MGYTPIQNGGSAVPGAWADDLCLNSTMGTDSNLVYNQWTDVDLFFDRYVGELAAITENESSQDESKAGVDQGGGLPQSNNSSKPASDPSGKRGRC